MSTARPVGYKPTKSEPTPVLVPKAPKSPTTYFVVEYEEKVTAEYEETVTAFGEEKKKRSPVGNPGATTAIISPTRSRRRLSPANPPFSTSHRQRDMWKLITSTMAATNCSHTSEDLRHTNRPPPCQLVYGSLGGRLWWKLVTEGTR